MTLSLALRLSHFLAGGSSIYGNMLCNMKYHVAFRYPGYTSLSGRQCGLRQLYLMTKQEKQCQLRAINRTFIMKYSYESRNRWPYLKINNCQRNSADLVAKKAQYDNRVIFNLLRHCIFHVGLNPAIQMNRKLEMFNWKLKGSHYILDYHFVVRITERK